MPCLECKLHCRQWKVTVYLYYVLRHGGHVVREDDDYGPGGLTQSFLVPFIGKIQQPHDNTAATQHLGFYRAGLSVQYGIPGACNLSATRY